MYLSIDFHFVDIATKKKKILQISYAICEGGTNQKIDLLKCNKIITFAVIVTASMFRFR